MNSLNTTNNRRNDITHSGYTILEIILGVFAIACIMLAIVPMFTYYTRINKAQALADQSINHSKIFIKYLLDNDKSIRTELSTANSVTYVTWDDIENGGYASADTADSNLLKQTPCMAVGLNTTTNQLTPYLFFVGGQNTTDLLSANTAMEQIGAIAGVYSTSTNDSDVRESGSGVFSVGNGWHLLSSSSNYISGIDQGCGDSLANNSIVINMSMMPEYASFSSSNDLSLHRYTDTSSDLGNSSNANTLQTDISLAESNATSSHKLYFAGNNESSGMYLWSNNASTNLTLQNGGFSANTLQPTKSVPALTYCSANDAGTIALQSDTNVPVKSQLQCTYDVLQCQGPDPTGITLNYYCYLPTVSMSINYTPNTTSFTCPAGSYIDNSAPPVVNLNMPNISTGNFSSCTAWDTSPYADKLCYTNNSNPCIWATPELTMTHPGIRKSYKSYQIYTDISYIVSWNWVFTKGDATTAWNAGGANLKICPQLTSALLGVITSATCTTTNPTVTYD